MKLNDQQSYEKQMYEYIKEVIKIKCPYNGKLRRQLRSNLSIVQCSREVDFEMAPN